MAKSRRTPSLVVRTPRHASRRVRPALAAEIRRIAKQSNISNIEVDHKFVANDPSHPLGIASDNASDWNSMLITARADRGPQWDVATQRFMVDHGSYLYFDSTPLTVSEEPTPAPPDEANAVGQSPADPAALWPLDSRFPQYNTGSGNLSNVSTPTRASLRLHHQHQQPIPPQQLHPHALNGHQPGNGMGMGNPYPYGLTNGRIPEQPHFAQAQAQVQMQTQMQTPHSYYDVGQGPSQIQNHPPPPPPPPNHGHIPTHAQHAMSNGMGLGSVGSPMLARQMGMTSGMGLGMDFGGPALGGLQDAHALEMRRRTRSQQDAQMEIGW